jgi:hypothetical protein
MPIKLGSTGKPQASSSAGLGLDTRSRLNQQLLANVQESSRYAFDRCSTSMAEEELSELQQLVIAGPRVQETAPQLEEQLELPPEYFEISQVEYANNPEPVVCEEAKMVDAQLYNRPAQVSRTPRGTIEFVVQEDGRTLTPEYNKCGILTAIDFGEGTKLVQSDGDRGWRLSAPDVQFNQPISIRSVVFDRKGYLTIV